MENKIKDPGQDLPDTKSKSERWYAKISVEPVIILYTLGTMIISVVEQSFYVYKACSVNHGYSIEICDNLHNYEEKNREVHLTVSTFHQWNSIASRLTCMAIGLFLGAWSDRRGRKLPLLVSLIGSCYYSIMLIVNSLIKSWPLEYIVYSATLPSVITGGEFAIYISCFSYIADVTSTADRTKRITIIDTVLYGSMPIGIALGSYIFKYIVGQSYTIMFILKTVCLLIAIVYTYWNLKWLTTSEQKSITEIGWQNYLCDFFDYKNFVGSLKTPFIKRSHNRRTYLWLIALCSSFFTFLRGERPLLYLYTQFKFHWDTEFYSNFKIFQTSMYAVMMFSAFPLMTKYFGIRDTIIAVIGATCTIVSRLLYGFAEASWIFYVGGAVCGLGAIVTTVSRSMLTKLVPLNERGKVFAILGLFENIMTFISGISYTQIYNLTIGKTPGIFWLTISTQIVIIVIMASIHISLRGKILGEDQEESDQKKVNVLLAPPNENEENN